MTQATQVFNTGNLPEGGWSTYRKTALTRAVRIDGPFVVETAEGSLRCADGYLALDARGYPYPIATDEFHLIYEADGKRG
jgi:hypothetical protein